MRVRLRFFGRLSEAVTADAVERELGAGARVADLRRELVGEYPGSGALATCMVAVNTDYAADDRELADGDEVAFIPPVSGG
ncbi:MAG: molybdopterin converting factor subunit 1 [Planctomycetota bacterium]